MLLYRKTFFGFLALLICMMNSTLVSQENQLAQSELQKIELSKKESIYKAWTKNALKLFIVCIALKYNNKNNTLFMHSFFDFPLKFLQGCYAIGLGINTFTLLDDAVEKIYKKIGSMF